PAPTRSTERGPPAALSAGGDNLFDPQTVLICAGALFLGGFTKGIAGLGLPMIAIPLLAFAVKLPTAVALLVIPTVVSNLFQAFQRGAFLPVLRRFWPFLAL